MRCHNRGQQLLPSNGSFRLLSSQENIGRYECGEDHGDYAVHGEEGGVEFREVVGLDQGVFVEQEDRNGDDARDGEFAESEGRDKRHQQEQHDEVEEAGDPKSPGDAEVARDGMEAGIAVEVEILTGVEDVEAGNPESDGGSEKQDTGVEKATNGDPGGGGRDA